MRILILSKDAPKYIYIILQTLIICSIFVGFGVANRNVFVPSSSKRGVEKGKGYGSQSNSALLVRSYRRRLYSCNVFRYKCYSFVVLIKADYVKVIIAIGCYMMKLYYVGVACCWVFLMCIIARWTVLGFGCRWPLPCLRVFVRSYLPQAFSASGLDSPCVRITCNSSSVVRSSNYDQSIIIYISVWILLNVWINFAFRGKSLCYTFRTLAPVLAGQSPLSLAKLLPLLSIRVVGWFYTIIINWL